MFDIEFLILLLILSLMVYRLTFMFVHEDGIFDVFKRFRKLVGVRMDTVTKKNEYGADIQVDVLASNNRIGEIFTCFKCCSVWVSILPALYYVSLFKLPLPELFGWWVVYTLVLSAIAIQFKRGT